METWKIISSLRNQKALDQCIVLSTGRIIVLSHSEREDGKPLFVTNPQGFPVRVLYLLEKGDLGIFFNGFRGDRSIGQHEITPFGQCKIAI